MDSFRATCLQGAHVVKVTGNIYPNDAVAYLRIASAEGRQPIAPVSIGEFRIGSAAECDLRLSDTCDIHSSLMVEENRITVRCNDTTQPLLVNGMQVAECQLCDGDLIEIGDHRMLLRLLAEETRITLDEANFVQGTAEDYEHTAIAERIVDQLEQQIDLIDELTADDNAGLESLVRAALEQTPSPELVSTDDEQTTEITIGEVRQMLTQHHEASRIRLESLTEVLNNVVQQQKLIADTLEVLSHRVQQLDQPYSRRDVA